MRKLLLLLFMLFTFPSMAHAELKITPTIIELNSENVRGNYITTSFEVSGGPEETIRFKVYPEFFNISEDGTMQVVDDPAKKAVKNSMLQCVRFVPNEFTLKNGEIQKVRVTISNIDKLPDGENRVVLFLEDVAVKEVELPSGNKNIATRLELKTRIGVPIYLDKGRITKNGKFEDLKVGQADDEYFYQALLNNTGNTRVRVSGKAQIIQNKELIDEFDIRSRPVSANGKLNLDSALPTDKIAADGEYSLRVVLKYKDETYKDKIMVKEVNFTVKGKNSKSEKSKEEKTPI